MDKTYGLLIKQQKSLTWLQITTILQRDPYLYSGLLRWLNELGLYVESTIVQVIVQHGVAPEKVASTIVEELIQGEMANWRCNFSRCAKNRNKSWMYRLSWGLITCCWDGMVCVVYRILKCTGFFDERAQDYADRTLKLVNAYLHRWQ